MLFAACLCSAITAQSFTQYVDPRIGTGDHGHVFVGASVPFGMITAGPTQTTLWDQWDWCSGYHDGGIDIVGFAQLHLSGTGCSDLGDIALMPTTESVELTKKGLSSPFSHESETIVPGYYAVTLQKHNIKAEITATTRTALYRFTYPQDKKQHLVVDLTNGVGDRMRNARLVALDDYTFVGYRVSYGWCDEQHAYFALKLNKKATLVRQGETPIYELQVENYDQELYARIALSPVSEANALENLRCESGLQWDFEAERKVADQRWNNELGRIDATFANAKDRTIFYTALYHFMIFPQVWDDVCGDWRGADNQIHRAQGQDCIARSASLPTHNVTTLSLWDTYRSAAPLSTLILPDMMPTIADTYLRIFKEQGKLPVWHLMSNETNCMVGCPAVPILADLFLKGFTKDTTDVMKAIHKSLTMDDRGLKEVCHYGYLPYDKTGEHALSKSMEYMLADWAAAQVAKAIGNEKLYLYFFDRSMGYKRLFDPRVRCMRALNSKGEFRSIEGFNPGHQTVDYTEGNPWQYSWLVPHDVEGLAELYGGKKAFLARLDSLFTADSDLGKDANPDISGLIGQYAHGNEPSHHITYFYTMMGEPRKTAKLVRQIMKELYTDQPAGLCGNEDAGQMSAWYILSALGFYQVEPCGGRYVMGSPLVQEAKVNVGNGNILTIRTHDNNDQNIYIKRVKFNGKTLSTRILNHADLVKGGVLDIYMTK